MGYEPVFKLPYSNVMMTDLFLTAYSRGGFDTTVVIKDGEWEFFLSHESLDDAAETGFQHAFDSERIGSLEQKYESFKGELGKLKAADIGGMPNGEFASFLKEFKLLCHEVCGVYKETEFFYFTKIENELNAFIEGKTTIDEVLSKRVDLSQWPEDKRKLAEYIIHMQHFKFEFRNFLNGIFMGKDSLLSIVSNQLISRTERDDALSMTFSEMEQVLGGQPLGDVSTRHELSIIQFDTEQDSLIIHIGNEAHELAERFKKNVPVDEVNGMPASKGFAHGKVKIIRLSLTPETCLPSNLEEGIILVSDTTGPEMVPIMKKVAAIVTDEGGLMSHAAVIAREFGIPCVVGTKYATEVFKDGDTIEVNADTGVVRKIKK